MNSPNENMSETETKVQNRKPKDSRLAEYSVVFTILAGVVALVTACSLACLPFAIVGLGFGIIALWQISRSRGKLTGLVSAISGIVINLGLLFVVLHSGYDQRITVELARRIICATNLNRLGKAIQNYSDENNGKYPTVDKWCDLLIEETDLVSKSMFLCKGAMDEGPSHYVINPNCEPNSPGDMVLLFESKGGWNQFGGPELLAPEHHDGEGCNILFNDGHVDFVETDKLGELKWK